MLEMIEKADSLSALERRFMDKFHLYVEPVRMASQSMRSVMYTLEDSMG